MENNANYNMAVEMGMDLFFQYLKEAMKERKMSQKRLCEIVGINKANLNRNFNKETEMSLRTFLKICAALQIRPYLVPAENDDTPMQRIEFN